MEPESELLTLAQICGRYTSEWVLLVDPEFSQHSELIRGKVLWHSKDRDELYLKDLELRPQSAAYLYTGTMPENSETAL